MRHVDIGLPVHNGERYVGLAIESILAQDHEDLTLTIGDNASSDGTESICRELAAADPRVRYLRSEVNRGATWNFNRLVDEARGPYFKWAAHDDLCEPRYLSECLRALEQHPDAALCHTYAVDIDEAGTVLSEWGALGTADQSLASERFRWVIFERAGIEAGCFPVFGVMRLADLRQVAPMGAYRGADRALLAALALRGRFLEVPEPLWLHRDHRERSVRLDSASLVTWWDPTRDPRRRAPQWEQLWTQLVGVRDSPVTGIDRWRAYRVALEWALRRPRGLGAEARDAVQARLPVRSIRLRGR